MTHRTGFYRLNGTDTVRPPDLVFNYDAAGNRISKVSKPRKAHYVTGDTAWTTTHYLRDAQGNVLSIYKQHDSAGISRAYFTQIEKHLYGSSRLGIDNSATELLGATFSTDTANHYAGNKSFELSNHLGNVLATVSDRRIPLDTNSNDTIDYYVAYVSSSTDYSPFGAPLDGRTFNAGKDRYGFNGKEKDDELKGPGSQQDYGMRIYDNRLGRFLSVDPMTKSYPELTPYQFASNSPISNVDIDGLEKLYYLPVFKANNGTSTAQKVVHYYTENHWYDFLFPTKYVLSLGDGSTSALEYSSLSRLEESIEGKTKEQLTEMNDASKAAEAFWIAESLGKAQEANLESAQADAQSQEGVDASITVETENNSIKPTTNNATTKAQAQANNGVKSNGVKKVYIDKNKYPESAKHIEEAQAAGKPIGGVLNRAGANQNRKDALKGTQTQTGMDRDEYPPAILSTGGKGASVKLIPSSDNRGSGASMGNQLKGVSDGTQVELHVAPTYNTTTQPK